MDRGGPGARWDGRAQAIQLGALLLFAILIINLSLFQVFVVPNQNSEIEFKHNQQIQEELKTARSLAQQAAATDSELSTSVRLAPQYPSRTVFVNPAPPAGTLETVDRSDLVVTNAEPLDAEAQQAWDTSGEAFATKALVFRPGYNYYSNAPTTVYGGSVLYNIQPDGTTVRNRTGQSLVNGNRITLVTMTGGVSTSAAGAETVEFQPTSAPTQRVPVRATGGDLTIQVKTRIPEDVWEDELLAGQIDDPTADENGDGDNDEPGRYVTDVTMVSGSPPTDVGTLEITFESGPDKTYSLRLGQVGVGDNVDDESASYITKVDPTADSLSVTENEEREVVVEVRDRYNNPISGVPVTVADPAGAGTVTATEDTTDERGRASFVYEGSSTGSETLEFTIPDDSFQGTGSTSGLDDAERVVYTATVNPAPGSGSGSSGGGAADYDLVWEDPSTTASVSTTSGTDCPSTPCPRNVDLAALTTDTDGNPLSTDGAPVSFGTSNDAVGTFATTQTTTSGGRAETALDLADPRALGEATLQTFSGGNRDTLAFDMQVTDSFDNDGALGPTWENIDSGDAVSVDSTASNSGSNAVQIGDVGEQGVDSNPGGGFVLADGIDTTGADTIVVEYWAQEGAGSGGPETGEGPEQLELQYKSGPDADDWTTADTLTVQDSPGTESDRRVRIAAADAKRSEFKIRFVQPSSTGDDEWYVDDVSLYVFGTTISGGTDGSGGTPSDTTAPQNPSSTSISPDPFGNEDVTVDIEFSSAPESGTVTVRLEDTGGNTETVDIPSDTGSTTTTATVPENQVDNLVDGTVTATAKIVDDAGNENPDGFTAASTATKDTTAPSLTDLTVDSTESPPLSSPPSSGRPFDVRASFESDEPLSSFDATLTDASGGTTTLDESDFTQSGSGPYTYNLDAESRPTATDDGDLQFEVSNAADGAGNTAGSGPVTESVDYYGAYYQYYEGNYGGGGDYMPPYNGGNVEATGQRDTFDIARPAGGQDDDFGFRFHAYVYVPQSGDYTFYTESDDGSDLYVNGNLVVENRGDHAPNEESGSVSFGSAGWQTITVRHYENGGGEELTARWEGPSFGKQEIPESNLVPRQPGASGGFDGGGSGGADLGTNEVAFADANDDGTYQSGETAYTTSQLSSFDRAVNLVVAKDTTTGTFNIKANSITVDPNVRISSFNGETKLTATTGDIILNVAESGEDTINAPKITLKAPSITLRDGAKLDSYNDRAKLTATTGSVRILQTGGGNSNRAISATKISINGQSVELADGAYITGYSSGTSVKATKNGGGDIDASGASIVGNKVTLESIGDIDLSNGRIDAFGSTSTATLNDASRTLFVDGTEIVDDNNELACSPSGITVQGTPSQGTVGCRTSADKVSYNNDGTADGPGNSNGARFSVTNLGGDTVTISRIAVDSSGSAGELLEKNGGTGEWNREAFIDTSENGYFESGDGGNDDYTLGGGSKPLDSQATIDSGADATFYLYRFTETGAGNSGGPVDMRGEDISVTVTFDDGSTKTIDFTG